MLILSCVALVDFLGNIFPESYLLLVWVVFSFPISILDTDSCWPVSSDLFIEDLLKKE